MARKIDFSHGFMREIKKNQFERCKYHDERARTLQLKKLHYNSRNKATDQSFAENEGIHSTIIISSIHYVIYIQPHFI